MSWVYIFLGFSALIILHEFGHFIAAKWTGMRVERFFLFFPPKLWSVKIGETEYGIGMIPAGGFVKITGMNPEELDAAEEGREPERKPGLLEQIEGADSGEVTPPSIEGGEKLTPEILKRAYYNQPVWKRIVVIAAGPAMNFLIAFVILFGLALTSERPTSLAVGEVESDSPAQGVLKTDDRIVSVDGVKPDQGGSDPSQSELGDRATAVADQINTHTCAGEQADGCVASTPVSVVIERDGQRMTVDARPFYDAKVENGEGEDPGRYRLGFAFAAADPVPEDLSVPQAAERSVDTMWDVTKGTLGIFARLWESDKRDEVSGVVGVSDVAHQTIEEDSRFGLGLLALVSLSLAIVNLFPILPLDGGHIFLSVAEKLRGRRISLRTMEKATAVGIALMLMLFFIGLSNDLGNLGDSINDR